MRAPRRHNSLASMSETLDEMFIFHRLVKLKDIRNRAPLIRTLADPIFNSRQLFRRDRILMRVINILECNGDTL
jgi:hypothetical protein